ncbi:MAG: hypothetical protein QM487_02930 [Candidatus Marithrix sp.]
MSIHSLACGKKDEQMFTNVMETVVDYIKHSEDITFLSKEAGKQRLSDYKLFRNLITNNWKGLTSNG